MLLFIDLFLFLDAVTLYLVIRVSRILVNFDEKSAEAFNEAMSSSVFVECNKLGLSVNYFRIAVFDKV